MLACLALTGCSVLDTIWGKEVKANFCAAHPQDRDCPDAGHDGKCDSNASCATPTGVCDVVGSMMCVQCIAPTETSACVGTAPVCGADHTCQACKQHADCPLSNACLPDGSCALAADVAYVQGGASAMMCTQAAPCGTLDEGVRTNRPYVKVAAGTVSNDKGTTIDGKAVVVLADPGARLIRTGPGVILQIQNDGADVKVFDLEITMGTGVNNPAVSVPSGGAPKLSLTRVKIDGNQGVGISVAGGSLTLSQSDVAQNTGGGVSVSGVGVTFDITNNFIYRNGDPDNGTFGGLSLGIAVAGTNRLEFNTIMDNRAAINSGGVVCNATAFAGPNNIIARNVLGMSTTAPGAQASPNGCTYPTSRMQDDASGLAFVDSEAPAPFDYRLMGSSNAIDQALTPSTVTIDHDGKPRPIGSQKDVGAFEFRP
jgi:hypothetical protein